jgi:hypothetical protein
MFDTCFDKDACLCKSEPYINVNVLSANGLKRVRPVRSISR